MKTLNIFDINCVKVLDHGKLLEEKYLDMKNLPQIPSSGRTWKFDDGYLMKIYAQKFLCACFHVLISMNKWKQG